MFKLLLFIVSTECTSDLLLNLLLKYDGAEPLKQLNVIIASMYLNIRLTGSHSRSCNAGVICLYFLVPVMVRTAKFCTFCNFAKLFL